MSRTLKLSRNTRQTNELSAKFHKEMLAIWSGKDSAKAEDADDLSSFPSPFGNGPVLSDNSGNRSRVRRTLPAGSQRDQRLSNDQGSGSEASDDSDDDLFQGIDMDALSNRGKGSYICPAGPACTKGGVDKDGNLISFERNSSFV